MQSEVFIVSRADLRADAPTLTWSIARPASSMFVGVSAALISCAIAWLLHDGRVSPWISVVGGLLVFCGVLAAPGRATFVFDFNRRAMRLPDGTEVSLDALTAVSLEWLPSDSEHDWANASILMTSASRAVRLDMMCQEIEPVERFAQRVCACADVALEKKRLAPP